MELIITVFLNIIPLYVIIAIGFFAGRLFHIDRKALADISLYVLMPVTLLGLVWQIDLKPEYFLLPIVMYLFQAVFALPALSLGKKVWHDNTANLFALCTSMPNSGYFGLPLVLFLFGNEAAAIYTMMLVGGVFFEATIGYYIAVRSHFDVKQSVSKLFSFPVLYAVSLALFLNFAGVKMNETAFEYWGYFKGGYIVIGMMIIGVAMSKMKRLEFGGGKFFSLVLLFKFLLWPLFALATVALDRNFLHLFDEQIHGLVLAVAILPPAANIAAFASQLNITPEKAATTVFIGTLFALFYIPAALWLLGINVS